MERTIDIIEGLTGGELPVAERLERICLVLKDRVPHYDWVGFYIVDPLEEGMLYLGPFAGAPTEHVRIPFGKGICGQAAAGKRTFIVQDVMSQDNYLSCSADVRSEIVLPVIDGDEVIGELDIDSHSLSPFSEEDKHLLGRVCVLVVPLVRELRVSRG